MKREKNSVGIIVKNISGGKYYYVPIPKALSNQLKLKKGDRLDVKMMSKGRGIYGIEFMKRRKV